MYKAYLSDLYSAWNQFWFSPVDLLNVSIFRFLLGINLLLLYGIRFADVEIFYYNNGMLPLDKVMIFFPEYMRPPFTVFFTSDTLIYWAHLALIILLFAFTLGWLNRFFKIILFILHLGFYQRNPGILYGVDLIVSFWLFYFCFVNSNEYLKFNSFKNLFSYKSFLGIKQKGAKCDSGLLSSVAVRMMQVQLCVVYAYTGLEKLKGSTWWDGSALWYIMADERIVNFDLSFFKHLPWLVAIMTFATLIFEVYFPFAVSNKRLKSIWLFLGLCLHIGAAVFMGLYFFSAVMLVAYVLFIDANSTRRFLNNKLKLGL